MAVEIEIIGPGDRSRAVELGVGVVGRTYCIDDVVDEPDAVGVVENGFREHCRRVQSVLVAGVVDPEVVGRDIGLETLSPFC